MAIHHPGNTFRTVLATIFWFTLALLTAICLPVVSGFSLTLFLGTLGAALVLAIPVWIIRRLVARPPRSPSYWITWLGTVMVLVCALGLPVYWLAVKSESDPLTVPLVTLSNGEKTVVFQGMVHIGSENFYKSVVYDLEAALAEGYDLFYEGVQPADAEADRWFAEFMDTGGDLSGKYKLLADLCGVKFQLDYFTLLQVDQRVHPERHVVADVTHRQMYDEWKRLHPTQTWKSPALDLSQAAGEDPFMRALEFARDGSETRAKVGGIVCRAMLTRATSQPKEDPARDAIVLDYRNRELVKTIAEHPGQQIYITYGAAHLPGIVRLLKQRDPAWDITSLRWIRAIESPEELSGDLVIEG